jgi:hypothetical protein
MDPTDLISTVAALDSAVLRATLNPSPNLVYHVRTPALTALLGTAADTLDVILRRFNTYIWNNSLTAPDNHVKLTPQLQEALAPQLPHTQTAPYNAVIVALMQHLDQQV